MILSRPLVYLSGSWENDQATGQGKLEYFNQDWYEGEVCNGLVFNLFSLIKVYSLGSWQNDKRHGFGKFVSVLNGAYTVYEGHWIEGVKHGNGNPKF